MRGGEKYHMKIIIVDDEPKALQAFLLNILESKNVDYRFFKNDEKSIMDYMLHNNVDGAFLDINMGELNGIALAKELIKINPKIKIVFITGFSTTMDDLSIKLKENVLGIIYKPYNETTLANYVNQIENVSTKLIVKMFDSFDCYINGTIVKFSSQKSKELFALLLVYNGRSLNMFDAISQLWPDNDVDKSKILYRDAVWRLRKTLKDINFECVDFKRANLFLNKNNISCDYWDYLQTHKGNYNGEFLKNYDWSFDYLPLLDKIAGNSINED